MVEQHLITPEREASRGYNVLLDFEAYSHLHALRNQLAQEEYTEKLSKLNNLTRFNLETSLGERFNVELFQTDYYLEDGVIKHPLYNEPFGAIIERGRQYRLQSGSKDTRREKAEAVGFIKAQEILGDPHCDSEKKIIIISPRGDQHSIYQHNFFDVYSKDENGNITITRFTCKFSRRQFHEAAIMVDPFVDLPQDPTDADFLTNPLVTDKSIQQIQQIFAKQEATMTQKEYQGLLEACTPLITIYINDLLRHPDIEQAKKNYHALLKFAEVYLGTNIQIRDSHLRQTIIQAALRPSQLASLAAYLATQPVRQVATACGLSGSSPFSVAEFGMGLSSAFEDQYGTLEIHCEECGTRYHRTPNKLEERCRFCGGTRGIVC